MAIRVPFVLALMIQNFCLPFFMEENFKNLLSDFWNQLFEFWKSLPETALDEARSCLQIAACEWIIIKF